MSEELKPCPFCGGRNAEVQREFNAVSERDYFYVRCLNCGGQGPDGDGTTRGVSSEQWNTRAEPEVLCEGWAPIGPDGAMLGRCLKYSEDSAWSDIFIRHSFYPDRANDPAKYEELRARGYRAIPVQIIKSQSGKGRG